jgi:histidyl-tRNA synthetase
MSVQRCKGMRDLLPGEMAAFRLIEGICRDCCSRWGYHEVRTPTIEYLHLFTSAGTLTPGMLGKVYSFLDWDGWSGERVVLRPDGTIPVARLYAENLEGEGLARLFYATNLFIFEETGGKNRERWQCGAELIGVGSAMADTELIELSLEVLKKLGLKDVELRLSHAGLMKALLEKLGLNLEEQHHLFDQILDGDVETLAKIGRDNPDFENTLLPLLSLKGQSPGFLTNQKAILAQSMPKVSPHLDNFLEVVGLLDTLGCRYQIDIASGAGFEYYTGVIFQFIVNGEKIGGGGRYDALIPSMGGSDVPASGFALYIDRLIELLKPAATTPPVASGIMVRPETWDNKVVKEAFATAASLRQAGYVVMLDLGGKKAEGFRWIIEVKTEAPFFSLSDVVSPRRFDVPTIGEVLKLLEGKGDDKVSFA